MTYDNLCLWKLAVKESGASVKKRTVTKDNTYYQAINSGVIVGFLTIGKTNLLSVAYLLRI